MLMILIEAFVKLKILYGTLRRGVSDNQCALNLANRTFLLKVVVLKIDIKSKNNT